MKREHGAAHFLSRSDLSSHPPPASNRSRGEVEALCALETTLLSSTVTVAPFQLEARSRVEITRRATSTATATDGMSISSTTLHASSGGAAILDDPGACGHASGTTRRLALRHHNGLRVCVQDMERARQCLVRCLWR